MRVLITGITGFVGSHLAEYALARRAEIFDSSRWRSKTDNIEHIRDHIGLVECDLRDLPSVQHLLELTSPDWIFTLRRRVTCTLPGTRRRRRSSRTPSAR